MGIFITILALGFVIFIHEMGHLLAAKYFGVGVYEFSVGMGPKVFSRKYNETEYSLRAFPFGGFVKLAGLDDEKDEPVDDALNFKKKPLFQRAVVISAGSIMNLILGFLIFLFSFLIFGVPHSTDRIESLSQDLPAAQAGLQAGDVIVAIDDVQLNGSSKALIRYLNDTGEKEMTLDVVRGAEAFSVSLTPVKQKGRYIIGVMMAVEYSYFNPIRSFVEGLRLTRQNIQLVFDSLKMLVTGEASIKHLTGPIGIVQFASFQLGGSLMNFFNVIAMITISLGVINLFPFPVLDGGHLVFIILEAIRRKPLSHRVEILITNLGALVLIGLMIFIVFNDIRFWGDRTQFLQTLFG